MNSLINYADNRPQHKGIRRWARNCQRHHDEEKALLIAKMEKIELDKFMRP